MDTMFMNSENSRTSEYHVLVLKLADKLNLRRSQKSAPLSNLSIYYTITISLKYLLQHGVIPLAFLMGAIPLQTYTIILSIFLRNIVKMLIIHQSKYM